MAIPNILSIAGSDPSGGAGIQADLKSITAMGGYGMCAIAALTVQNTRGVEGVHVPPASFLSHQLTAVSDDIRIDAVKIGMLADTDNVHAVAQWWDKTFTTSQQSSGGPAVDSEVAGAATAEGEAHFAGEPAAEGGAQRHTRPYLVIDPVMVSTSGARLLDVAAEKALRDLIYRADLLTPNVPELALLAGAEAAETPEQLHAQAEIVADEHQVVVLAKGGHLLDQELVDLLVYPAQGDQRAEAIYANTERIETKNTHGTGCSVSSALATLAGRGITGGAALTEVQAWVGAALRSSEALSVGHGYGPMNHFAAFSSQFS